MRFGYLVLLGRRLQQPKRMSMSYSKEEDADDHLLRLSLVIGALACFKQDLSPAAIKASGNIDITRFVTLDNVTTLLSKWAANSDPECRALVTTSLEDGMASVAWRSNTCNKVSSAMEGAVERSKLVLGRRVIGYQDTLAAMVPLRQAWC